MSPRDRRNLPDRLHDYVLAKGLREHPVLRELRLATDALPDAGMRSSAEQAQLLAFLIELMGASRVLEIGCFTGYGTLAMALALPPEGRVVTLDVNEHWPAIGRRHWERAGVADRIELRLGLALDGLDRLADEGAALRPGLCRRRQEALRRLLRARPGAGAAGRRRGAGQRALARRRGRSRRTPTIRRWPCARSTRRSAADHAGHLRAAADRRRR